MKYLMTLILTVFSFTLFSQVRIDQSGEGWKEMVDNALVLIQKTDTSVYNHLMKHCTKIGFWNGDYSSSEGTEIFVSRSDILLGSVENLACVVIHEAKHLELQSIGISLREEECICYTYELEFINKLQDVEWLKQNCELRLNQYDCYNN
jgi:hypothetical protein